MRDETFHCQICRSTRIRERPFGYSFKERWLGGYECLNCRVIFIHPQPTATELKELYSKDYFDGDFRCGHEGNYFDDRTLVAVVDNALLDRIGQFKSAGHFLEVGCAGGAFLDAARRRGYDARGVEFAAVAARFARDRFGLDVVTGDVRDARFNDSSFDVVFLGDVIEHLPEPVATLMEVHRILAMGGLLVIVCPSQTNTIFSRLGFALFSLLGLRARVTLPPYHVHEYRPASIRFLLRQCGFDTLKVTEAMISPGRVALRGPLVRRLGKKFIQYPNYIITTLFGILGDRLEVFAAKR
jgi:SAM-dependent methyltransferase